MTTVRELLNQKGKKVFSIRPDTTVFDAVAKMAEQDIGSLVVMDGENSLASLPSDIMCARLMRARLSSKAKRLSEYLCETLWKNTSLLPDQNNWLKNAWPS